MTAVIAVGDLPRPPGGGGDSLSAPAQASCLEEAVDRAEALLTSGAHAVLAVYGTWDGPATEAVRLLRALVRRGTVVPVPTALPPLAVFALAAELSRLRAHRHPPGQLVAAAAPLAAGLVVVARMATVAKLSYPPPSVTQHARSWLPGTGFLVQVAPHPAVTPMDGDGSAAFTDLPLAAATVLHASGPGAPDPSWVTDVVVPAVAPRLVVELSAAGQEAYYGTTKITEVVAYPELVELPASALHTCRWCEEPVASSPCPFCGCGAGLEVPV